LASYFKCTDPLKAIAQANVVYFRDESSVRGFVASHFAAHPWAKKKYFS
jgi:hypothetical protein